MEVRHNNICYPYSSAGSFIEYVEGLTYEHVNFIFSGASHAQVPSEIFSRLRLDINRFFCTRFIVSFMWICWDDLAQFDIQCRNFQI